MIFVLLLMSRYFLGRPLSPPFVLRVVTVASGEAKVYDEEEWRDALVVVETGHIEVETLTGSRRGFRTGDMLCLVGLKLRALHNPGPEPAVLLAVSRRESGNKALPRSSFRASNAAYGLRSMRENPGSGCFL